MQDYCSPLISPVQMELASGIVLTSSELVFPTLRVNFNIFKFKLFLALDISSVWTLRRRSVKSYTIKG